MTRPAAGETDPLDRFGLLASALGGRPLAVAGAKGPGWTDGKTVFVDLAEEPRRQVITISALIGAGSLDVEVLREISGRPSLTNRYLAIEGRRVLATLEGRLPRAVLPDAGGLPTKAGELASPSDSLQLARSRVRVPPAPSWFGQLRPRRIDLDGHSAAASTTLRVAELTEEDEGEDDSDDGPGKDGRRVRNLRNSAFGGNALSRAVKSLIGSNWSAAASAGTGTELRTARGRSGQVGSGAEVLAAGNVISPVAALSGLRGSLYPEWDEARGEYRQRYCSVLEVSPGPHQLAPLERPARHHGLRRELAKLGLGPRRERAQRSGYDLDLDAVVDAHTVSATGQSPPDTVYVDNLRHRRELSVLVLVDASGSGEEKATGGETVFQLQRAATAALVDTVAQLGDRVAAYAFRSRGRQVSFVRLKGFDEHFGSATLNRIGGLRPGGFTRFGGAVRHATHLLHTDGGMHRRLLVVISDGFPYDQGYENSYAEADARKALDEARASGVGCLCLCLGSSTPPEALARIYARTEYANSPDLDALTPSILRLFHGALRTAELRRRYGAERGDLLNQR